MLENYDESFIQLGPNARITGVVELAMDTDFSGTPAGLGRSAALDHRATTASQIR